MRVSYVNRLFPKAQEYTEDGYCVCVYSTPDDLGEAGNRLGMFFGEIVATGYYLPQNRKTEFDFEGEWVDSKYGKQFKVSNYKELIDLTEDGIKAYLASGLIKGIGPKTAEKIVKRFGAASLKVIEKEPEKLLEIKGITKNKLENIVAGYIESRAMSTVLQLLAPFGVSTKTAMKIYKEFGIELLSFGINVCVTIDYRWEGDTTIYF